MLYVLIAVTLCLAAPQLAVWVYRRLPRRAPPPVPYPPLGALAAGLRREKSETVAAVVRPESGPPAVEIPRRQATGPAGDEGEPLPPSPCVTADAPRVAMPSYRWLSALTSAALLPTAFALGAGWAVLFHHLGEARARSFGQAVFLFKPYSYGMVCAVPGLLLGIFSVIPLLLLFMRLLLGRRRFIESLFWEEGRFEAVGRNVDAVLRAFRWLALFVSLATAVFVGLALNWYARFTDDAVVIKRLLVAREEVHPYGSVVQIVWVRPAGEVDQPVPPGDVHLRFADGQTWGTDQTFFLPADAAERQRFFDFLREKTGRPITRARSLQDVPGW
jgi:hypothetical protein